MPSPRRPWTEAELRVALDPEPRTAVVAAQLGRTVQAVWHARERYALTDDGEVVRRRSTDPRFGAYVGPSEAHRSAWSEDELFEVLTDPDPLPLVAERVGRTVLAVRAVRRKYEIRGDVLYNTRTGLPVTFKSEADTRDRPVPAANGDWHRGPTVTELDQYIFN